MASDWPLVSASVLACSVITNNCVSPLRLNSRLTLEGERPSDAAIERMDWSATTPREISSRSVKVSATRDPRSLLHFQHLPLDS